MPLNCSAGTTHYTRDFRTLGQYTPPGGIPNTALRCNCPAPGGAAYTRTDVATFDLEEIRRQEQEAADQELRNIRNITIPLNILPSRNIVFGFYGPRDGGPRLNDALHDRELNEARQTLRTNLAAGTINRRQYTEQLLQERQRIAATYHGPEAGQRIQERVGRSQERYREERPYTLRERLLWRQGRPLAVNVAALGVSVSVGIWLYLIFGSWALLAGFVLVGFYNFFPAAENIGAGAARSALKVTIIILFTWGLYNTIYRPLGLIAAIIGYFTLSSTIESNNPQGSIEAPFRMLMAIVIGIIFVTLFNSWLLGLISIAFLLVPPNYMASTRGVRNQNIVLLNQAGEAHTAADNIIFTIIMFIVLLGSGALAILPWIGALFVSIGLWGWALTGAFAALFLIYWIVAWIAGITSAPQARPYIGMLFIGFAFMAFTFGGPGSNDVGSAFFGQWWPQVYQTGINVFGPIKDSFEGFSDSLGQGINLLTNPTGFAQGIIEGNFGRDKDTGLAGALGLDIETVRATQIRPYQPYSVIVKMRNKGSASAENVTVDLIAGKGVPNSVDVSWFVFNRERIDIPIESLGFSTYSKDVGTVAKKDVREIFFDSEYTGLVCGVVNEFELRNKPLPIVADVEYDYKIESTVDLEVLSEEEWEKRIKETTFATVTKKAATLTNSPVKLNLGLPEQPHREGLPFSLEIELKTAQKRGNLKEIYNVEVTYPYELEVESCTGDPTPVDEGDKKKLIWVQFPQTGSAFCHFKPANIATTSKNFVFNAKSDFRFFSLSELPAIMEFGGGCCSKYECLGGLECNWEEGMDTAGMCTSAVSRPVNGGSGGLFKKGSSNYCEKVSEENALCEIGEGGCTSVTECSQVDQSLGAVSCRSVEGVSIPLCCPDAADEQCRNIFVSWVKS